MSEGPEGMVSYEMILQFEQMWIRYSGNQTIYKPQNILHACPLADHNVDRVDIMLGNFDKPSWFKGLLSNT